MTLPVRQEHPWERAKGESGVAFTAFALYRDLGPARSLAKTAKALGKSEGMVGTWSSRWHWVERCAAYDAMIDERMRLAREDEQEQMVRRHASLASSLGLLAFKRLHGDPNDAQVIPAHPNEIETKDLPRFVEVAIRSERLASGLPTDVIKAGLLVQPAEVSRIVNQIVGLALDAMPEDRQEAFLDAVAAIGRE